MRCGDSVFLQDLWMQDPFAASCIALFASPTMLNLGCLLREGELPWQSGELYAPCYPIARCSARWRRRAGNIVKLAPEDIDKLSSAASSGRKLLRS